MTGVVQGVFFRARCRERAVELGVTGWARNHADGSVRGHFEGEPDAVRGLVAWCHEGSPRAVVDAVEVSVGEVGGAAEFVTG